jgi:hypothetical protein
MDESSAVFVVLVGWGNAHSLEGVSYAYEDIYYYFPDDVTRVALELNAYPQALLEGRFREQADNFRIASAAQVISTMIKLFLRINSHLQSFYADSMMRQRRTAISFNCL